MLWFHDNLEGVLSDENSNIVTKSMMLELANGYLARFQEEIDQIYKNFTMEQLDGIQNTYLTYVEKFEAKLIDLKIRQNLKNKYKTC